MTTPDLTINKMTVIDGQPNLQGNRLLAAFDLTITGTRICGCLLVEKAGEIVKATGPMGKTHRGIDIRVSFEDAALSRAITRKAADAYGVLTGREVADE